MVRSSFMAASGHRPTPATCYPPPKDPPLTPEGPCFPYPPNSLVNATLKFTEQHKILGGVNPGPTTLHTAPALLSYNETYPRLTANFYFPHGAPLTFSIECHAINGFANQWLGRFSGLYIDSQNAQRQTPLSGHETHNLTIPGSYLRVQMPTGGAWLQTPNYSILEATVQFDSPGAPPLT